MSDFFDSDIVQAEARQMEILQMKAMQMTLDFSSNASKVDQLNYISAVRELVEKQQIFYARLKLSDDKRAKEVREHLEENAKLMYNWWPTADVSDMMKDMLFQLKKFEKQILAGEA